MPLSVVVQASFATLCAGLVYGVFSAYSHRARLARWQKQGVVSLALSVNDKNAD